MVLGGTAARRDTTARALRRSGARTHLLGDDLDLLELGLAAAGADIVVDLNVTGCAEVRPGAWRRALERTYTVLAAVSPRWSGQERVDACSYVVVTGHGGALGHEPALIEQPLSGIWAGLAKTLPRELPTCRVRVVDLPEADDPGPAVLGELLSGRLFEVAWLQGQRSALVPYPARRDDDGPLAGPPDPGATVLVTGGGRGIGYHLGRHLRARWGCRVVVTGRLDLDRVDRDVAVLDEEGFRDLTQQRLRACRGGPQLREVRAELAGLARGRELWRNLEAARRAGAELEYRVCDVTDAAAVSALLGEHDGAVGAVVHDAGIDRPARVAAKQFRDVAAVVSTKVDGLLHLLAAGTAQPAPICAVGSLTGRFGGTAGQSDYAGANEALARLAEWAGPRRAQPVTCLSWPTWQGLGLITNHRAAVREMSAVGVEAGVRAWEAELRRPRRGEVLFLAEVGPMTPPQARGTTVPSDHPGAADLLARRRRLGQLERWAPGSVLHSRHRVSTRTLTAAAGFHVAGRPSIPVSVLVDLMLDAADWLHTGSGENGVPADQARAQPPHTVVTRLRVQVSALVLPAGGTAEIVRTAHANGPEVAVSLSRVDPEGSATGLSPVATATVVRRARRHGARHGGHRLHGRRPEGRGGARRRRWAGRQLVGAGDAPGAPPDGSGLGRQRGAAAGQRPARRSAPPRAAPRRRGPGGTAVGEPARRSSGGPGRADRARHRARTLARRAAVGGAGPRGRHGGLPRRDRPPGPVRRRPAVVGSVRIRSGRMSARATATVVGCWVTVPAPAPGSGLPGVLALREDLRSRTREAVRRVAAELCAVPLETVAITTDERGRPLLDVAGRPLGLSITRSGARSVALVRADGPVGVDLERLDRDLDVDVVARYFYDSDEQAELAALPTVARRQRFFELWTWKEAVLKCAGLGLQAPLPRAARPARAGGLVLREEERRTLYPEPGTVLTVVTPDASPRLRWCTDHAPPVRHPTAR